MMHLTIVNAQTGEPCESCTGCKVVSVTSPEDLDNQIVEEGHIIVEQTNEEINKYIELQIYTKEGDKEILLEDVFNMTEPKTIIRTENKYKIDVKKAPKKVKDRIKHVVKNIHGIHYGDKKVEKVLIKKRAIEDDSGQTEI